MYVAELARAQTIRDATLNSGEFSNSESFRFVIFGKFYNVHYEYNPYA